MSGLSGVALGISFSLLALLPNCSSFSSPFGSSANSTAVSSNSAAQPMSNVAAAAPVQTEDDNTGGAYPKVSLIDYFRNDNAPTAPRPPATYAATAQPAGYTSPPGTYPAAQAATYAAQAPAAPAADVPANGAYPRQSLFDYFKGSTDQGQNVPRPPPTYTASGAPYSPSRQSNPAQSGTTYPASPPAQQPAANSSQTYSTYPQQASGGASSR